MSTIDAEHGAYVGALPPLRLALRRLFPSSSNVGLVMSGAAAAPLLGVPLLFFTHGYVIASKQNETMSAGGNAMANDAINSLFKHGSAVAAPIAPHLVNAATLDTEPQAIEQIVIAHSPANDDAIVAVTQARQALLRRLLQSRLSAEGIEFSAAAVQEIGGCVTPTRFSQLIAVASRHALRRIALVPSREELHAARAAAMDVNIARWTVLDALRAFLVLSHGKLDRDSFVEALEQAFRYADEGELCALYRTLPLLPLGARFAWRASEGCRSNMRSVFEAVACDSQYPAAHFDDVAWRQLIMKAIFVNAPLWRVHGLDSRLSPELARMALDFVDERRSAHRPIPPQLWLCLGPHGEERALNALRVELQRGDLRGRRAALLALARAGQLLRVHQWQGAWLGDLEPTLAQAQAGAFTQASFGEL